MVRIQKSALIMISTSCAAFWFFSTVSLALGLSIWGANKDSTTRGTDPAGGVSTGIVVITHAPTDPATREANLFWKLYFTGIDDSASAHGIHPEMVFNGRNVSLFVEQVEKYCQTAKGIAVSVPYNFGTVDYEAAVSALTNCSQRSDAPALVTTITEVKLSTAKSYVGGGNADIGQGCARMLYDPSDDAFVMGSSPTARLDTMNETRSASPFHESLAKATSSKPVIINVYWSGDRNDSNLKQRVHAFAKAVNLYLVELSKNSGAVRFKYHHVWPGSEGSDSTTMWDNLQTFYEEYHVILSMAWMSNFISKAPPNNADASSIERLLLCGDAWPFEEDYGKFLSYGTDAYKMGVTTSSLLTVYSTTKSMYGPFGNPSSSVSVLSSSRPNSYEKLMSMCGLTAYPTQFNVNSVSLPSPMAISQSTDGYYQLKVIDAQGTYFVPFRSQGGTDFEEGAPGYCWQATTQFTLRSLTEIIKYRYSYAAPRPVWAKGLCGGNGAHCLVYQLNRDTTTNNLVFKPYSYDGSPYINVSFNILFNEDCTTIAGENISQCVSLYMRFETSDYSVAYNAAWNFRTLVRTKNAEGLFIYVDEGHTKTGFELWTTAPDSTGKNSEVCAHGYYWAKNQDETQEFCCKSDEHIVCMWEQGSTNICACCPTKFGCYTYCSDNSGCGCPGYSPDTCFQDKPPERTYIYDP